MTNKIEGIVIGGMIAVFGLYVYPYWLTYVWTPIRDLLTTSLPHWGLWETTFIKLVPLGSFILILFIAFMFIFSRFRHKEGQE